jgi:surface antigen
MKTRVIIAAPLLVIALAVAGCTNTGPKRGAGTIIGAGVGALAGSQVGSGKGQLAAVAIGTLLGAAIGSELGAALDAQDRQLAEQASYQAHEAPIGEPIAWENPESGNSGTVTAIREGTQKDSGDYCREYQTEIVVGGQVEQGYGTACQRPDGSWEIVG